MKTFLARLLQHPAGILYSILLVTIALISAVPTINAGSWDAALVDIVMTGLLIYALLNTLFLSFQQKSGTAGKITAWCLLAAANLLLLLPSGDISGSLTRALAGAILIYAVVLTYSGAVIAGACIAPTLWCCVFMPYREELLLAISYPLRLSATMLSAEILRLFGMEILYSGSSIHLNGLNIAITDACSGINQLDAFFLLAYITIGIMHKKKVWKVLHFAFIIPAIIAGNSLRIILTLLLYTLLGECVLENTWHVSLGFVQIISALVIFILFGKILNLPEETTTEVKP